VIGDTLPTIDSMSTTLPGWGNWTGDGMRPRPPTQRQQREQREAQRKLLAAQQLALNSRRDSHLPHVVISDKSDKRASKYLLARLPFPYTSVDAYEQSLLQPLGKEWNSVAAHQQAIMPQVVVKQGAIIEAITYHQSAKERKDAESKEEEERQKKRERGGEGKKKNRNEVKKGGGKGGERRGLEGGKKHKTAGKSS
jgi:hypothetical protein